MIALHIQGEGALYSSSSTAPSDNVELQLTICHTRGEHAVILFTTACLANYFHILTNNALFGRQNLNIMTLVASFSRFSGRY